VTGQAPPRGDVELPAAWRERLRFDDRGLIPVVTQEARTGRVLMLAWANETALAATLADGQATYWSRSRGELWVKGATSGHTQRVRQVACDCDGDTVLYLVDQTGPACHTGATSCFDSPTSLTVGFDEGTPGAVPWYGPTWEGA